MSHILIVIDMWFDDHWHCFSWHEYRLSMQDVFVLTGLLSIICDSFDVEYISCNAFIWSVTQRNSFWALWFLRFIISVFNFHFKFSLYACLRIRNKIKTVLFFAYFLLWKRWTKVVGIFFQVFVISVYLFLFLFFQRKPFSLVHKLWHMVSCRSGVIRDSIQHSIEFLSNIRWLFFFL